MDEILSKMDYSCSEKNDLNSRNRFMAKCLNLIVTTNEESIAHIGGCDHVIESNPEGATPVHKLVTNFDVAKGKILCRERDFYREDNYFWIDGIDKKIRKQLKKSKILCCNVYPEKEFLSRNYLF